MPSICGEPGRNGAAERGGRLKTKEEEEKAVNNEGRKLRVNSQNEMIEYCCERKMGKHTTADMHVTSTVESTEDKTQ